MAGDLQGQVDELRSELAAMRRRAARRRSWRGRFPLALVALLMGLVPLSLVAAGPVFSDLGDAAPVHRPNIQAIGDAGITTGFEDPNNPNQRTYNPTGLVTREEMASFLARTAGLGGNPPVVNALTAQSAGFATNANYLAGKPATDYQLAGQPIANATNAAQLGGQPANAYALKSEVGGTAGNVTAWQSFFGVRGYGGRARTITEYPFLETPPPNVQAGPYVEAHFALDDTGNGYLVLPISYTASANTIIKSVTVCFSLSTFDIPLDRVRLLAMSSGTPVALVTDTTPRLNTAPGCYTIGANTPTPVTGALTLELRLRGVNSNITDAFIKLYAAGVTVGP